MICLAYENYDWGCSYLLHDETNYKINRIEIGPNKKLSYQFHKHRTEIWTIIDGEGLVTLNDEKFILNRGDCIQIPKGAIHKIENTLAKKLIFIEIQTGKELNAKDVLEIDENQVAFDEFGRNTVKE
jgi:mannose-6-phosphate isomerase-like protein (cupin superfamily)